MELASMRGGTGLIATSLQLNPSLQATISGGGTILCPAKNSPWQPVMAHLPVMAATSVPCTGPPPEIPKESIIANTDFTTTSVIAKRRLSSKKRKQQQSQSGSSIDESHIAQSPSITSTQPDPHSAVTATTASTTTGHSISSTSSAQPVAQTTQTYSHLSGGSVGPSPIIAVPAPQYIPMSTAVSLGLTQTSQVVTDPFATGMSYQVMQHEQHSKGITPGMASTGHQSQQRQMAFCKPANTHTADVQAQRHSSDKTLTDFKWSTAHVFIANRIQQHQKQLKQQKLQQEHLQQQYDTAAIRQQQLLHQQQQQQLALLQLYGCLPAAGHGTLISLPAVSLQPELHQQQRLQLQQISLLSATAAANTSTQHQLIGLHLPTAAAGMYHGAGAGIPLALAPADVTTQAYFHAQNGAAAAGSWVTPVPVVGSCVVNPLQAPGLLAATSWVK